MKNAIGILTLSLLCAAIVGCGVQGRIVQPRAAASPAIVPAGPAIDGALNDPAWKLAPALTLGKIENGQPGKLTTTAHVAMDAENLYVAWNCVEGKTASIKAPTTDRDGPLWNDDCVELFVAPRPGKGYYHFIVNSKGVMLDARCGAYGEEGTGWTSKAKVAARVVKDERWVVELAVPLSDLEAPSGPGQTWSLNLNRTRPLGPNVYVESSWSKAGTSRYADGSTWGKLVDVKVP